MKCCLRHVSYGVRLCLRMLPQGRKSQVSNTGPLPDKNTRSDPEGTEANETSNPQEEIVELTTRASLLDQKKKSSPAQGVLSGLNILHCFDELSSQRSEPNFQTTPNGFSARTQRH